MGSAQSQLSTYVFPELSDSEIKTLLNSLSKMSPSSDSLDLVYERTLGKGRVCWSILVRSSTSSSLLLLRLFAKSLKSGLKRSSSLAATANSSMDPLSATKLSFIHELYYEKCSQFDFVLKPLFINESDEFLVLLRPFARFNLPDRINTESLTHQDKVWIARQLLDCFVKFRGLRAFHGDFGTGKVLLTSQNQVLLTDFAPIKPFCLQNRSQSPLEFYQIWFEEGLDGDASEIGKGCYLAPERLKFNSVESFGPSDMFSLGCVLAELFSSTGESFLQFKDALKLSQSNSKQEYMDQIDHLIAFRGVQFEFIPLIRTLCSESPEDRVISSSHFTMIDGLIDSNAELWRDFFISYRGCQDYYSKKDLIKCKIDSTSPSCQITTITESLILLCLREADNLLRLHLLELLFKNCKFSEDFIVNESLYNALNESKMCKNVFERHWSSSNVNQVNNGRFKLLNALKSFSSNVPGSRDVLFQQILPKELDLGIALSYLDLLPELGTETKLDLLEKLLQIYRSRGTIKRNFEAILLFKYYEIGTANNRETLLDAFKSCSLDPIYNLSCECVFKPANLQRIGFQLDLTKNKVPIQESESKEEDEKKTVFPSVFANSHLVTSKFRQRLLTSPIEWKFSNNVMGILQSPDHSLLLIHSERSLFFWDLKGFMGRVPPSEPLATINPRANSVISCVIFGPDSNTLYIAFTDGIVGIYKIDLKILSGGVLEMVSFNINESFGPFGQEGFQLIMMKCSCGPVLLLLGKDTIYGLFPDSGIILFEFHFNFSIVKFYLVESSSLFCLGADGIFRLCELFYQTGEVLASWSLTCDAVVALIENFTIEKQNSDSNNKFNLVVEFGIQDLGRVICVYSLDPLSEIISCRFRNWIIHASVDDKALPSINCVRQPHTIGLSESFAKSHLIITKEEIIHEYDGILRLTDFACLSSQNSSSILFSTNYKPSLKLRNKRDIIPEIIEKSPLDSGFHNENSDNNLGIIHTIDGKYSLIIALLAGDLSLFC